MTQSEEIGTPVSASKKNFKLARSWLRDVETAIGTCTIIPLNLTASNN
jgi:hypothetical protein